MHTIMVPFAFDTFITDLKKVVADGSIPMSRIDDAVSRILRVKFQTGLFEYLYADKSHLGAASQSFVTGSGAEITRAFEEWKGVQALRISEQDCEEDSCGWLPCQ